MRPLLFALAFCLAPIVAPASAQQESEPAAAAPPPGVTLDLNKLEPVEGACRAYLVLENGTDQAFSAFVLDLYIFGPDGVIAKRLAVETAPLVPGKTRVRPLDIVGTACPAVSKILVNDVLDCADPTGQRDDCVALITTSSHSSAEFFK